jgi:hypothetical protein
LGRVTKDGRAERAQFNERWHEHLAARLSATPRALEDHHLE